MKDASKYNKFYLSGTERKLIDKVVGYIVDNHQDDEWWKIDRSIRNCVGFSLGYRLADDEFAEHMAEEEKREEENRLKRVAEESKEQEEEERQKLEADKQFQEFIREE